MNKELLESLEAEWKASPKTAQALPDRLPLRKITLMPEVFQCREGFKPKTGVTNEGKAHVAKMVDALNRPGSPDLDPLTVIRVGARDILTDGHHRLAAYKHAQRLDAPVRHVEVGPKAALVKVGEENQKTKLSLTSSDRSEWAWRLVRSRLYSKAEEVLASGVSDGTIGIMRRALKTLEAKGEPIPHSWRQVKVIEFKGEEGAKEQAEKWALLLKQAVGPAKTFKTLGKKHILRDALVLAWGERMAEELTYMLADDLDIRAKVDEQVALAVEEMTEEALDTLVAAKAEEMLVKAGKIPKPEF